MIEILAMVTGIICVIYLGGWIEAPYSKNKTLTVKQFIESFPRFRFIPWISSAFQIVFMVFLFLIYAPRFFPHPGNPKDWSIIGLIFFFPVMYLIGELALVPFEVFFKTRCILNRYPRFSVDTSSPKVGVRRIIVGISIFLLLIFSSRMEWKYYAQQGGPADANTGRR